MSKRYRIGLEEEMHDTLAGALTDTLTRPIRNLRRLRRLTTFEDGNQRSAVSGPSSDGIHQATDGDIIWALKDVSFEMERGEVVGIIGRNGAGKIHVCFVPQQPAQNPLPYHRAHPRARLQPVGRLL